MQLNSSGIGLLNMDGDDDDDNDDDDDVDDLAWNPNVLRG